MVGATTDEIIISLFDVSFVAAVRAGHHHHTKNELFNGSLSSPRVFVHQSFFGNFKSNIRISFGGKKNVNERPRSHAFGAVSFG